MARWVLRGLIAAVVTLSLAASPAWARDLTEAEKAGLATTIADFDAAMRANDIPRIISTVPPKMFAAMAEANNLTVEQLRDATIAATEQAMASVTFVSFKMDIAAATYASAGEEMPYALVPTETVMKFGEDTIKAAGDTLALLDEGVWYLVRVSEAPQADLLRAIYPAFADVTFAPGTMEKVEE